MSSIDAPATPCSVNAPSAASRISFRRESGAGSGVASRWRADVGDVWESYRSEPEEFFEGDEVVVVFTRERGRARGSGIEVDQRPTALLCRLRAGRVTEIRLYHDRERALRDAGLAE